MRFACISEFWGDVRFGLRLLAKSPVFALTVSLLLGIGIGVNTLIFSLVDTLLLRPLPVKHPEQLVRLIEVHPTNFIEWDLPYMLCEQLANASSLSEVFCQGDLDLALEEGNTIERIRVNSVSKNFFSALGIHAYLGRVLTPNDDDPEITHAVVSYELWQRQFHGSTSIIGRNIRLSGRAFTVIGVLPKEMNGTTIDTSPDIRIPVTAARLLDVNPASTVFMEFQIFGRLRPGIARECAEAEIEPLLRGPCAALARPLRGPLIRAFPELAKGPRRNVLDSRLRLEPIENGVSSLARPVLLAGRPH